MILPARAGVIPNIFLSFIGYPHFTRTSGGDPGLTSVQQELAKFYPHERG